MKAIIFDCDGTLVDSEMIHYHAWSHALKNQGYELPMEEYCHFVGTPTNITAQVLAKKIGKECAEDLKKDKHAYFTSQIEAEITPIKDTLEFLHRLFREQDRYHYKLAIASGAGRVDIMHYIRHLKIESFFDLVLSGKDDLSSYNDPEGTNKPKPYVYLEAARQLGAVPSECIAIEDSYPGVLAGATAGCITVAIPHAFSKHHDFSASDMLIPSLSSYSVDRFLNEAKLSRDKSRQQL